MARDAFPNVSVKFIPGRSPELIHVGRFGEDLKRESVEKLTFDQLVAKVTDLGFPRKDAEHAQPEGDL